MNTILHHIPLDLIEMITVSCKNKKSFDEIVKIITKLDEKYHKDRILDKLIVNNAKYNDVNNTIEKHFIEKHTIEENNITIRKWIYHSSYNKPAMISTNGDTTFFYNGKKYRDKGLPYYIGNDGERAWNQYSRGSLPYDIGTNVFIYCFDNLHIINIGLKSYFSVRNEINYFDYI